MKRADPIDRLRRIAELLELAAPGLAEKDPEAGADAAWFAAGVRRYDMGAARGVTLEDALSLSPSAPGEAPWWRREALQRRDEAIRRLRDDHFADLELPKAAREIAALAAYVTAGKKRSLEAIDPEAAQLVTDALCTGLRFPGPKQVQNILEIK